MGTTKKGMLIVVALLTAIAFAGSASADPVGGEVNSTVAEGQIVTLYLDVNPSDYVTTIVDDQAPSNDDYYFDWIAPMLVRNGFSIGDLFNATIEMRCSGVEREIDGTVGNPYTNTLRNTIPSTAHIQAVYDGAYDDATLIEVEPCATQMFSKDFYVGWNLISLPLTSSDNSASSVLASVWEYLSAGAVYTYNAETKKFESAATMNPSMGYFVYVTSDCTWEYSGTPYTSISTELEQGLNMVGWLNCPKDIGEALSSISGDYYYVARWNAAAQKFEVYNPAAPSAFNDFTTMDQGTGYFISARQDCTLSESC